MSTPVPPITIADSLVFANPSGEELERLGGLLNSWMEAVVLATPFWGDVGKLNKGVDLEAGLSPLVAASIRFDPERQLRVTDFNPDKVTEMTRRCISFARKLWICCAVAALPAVLRMMPHLTALTIRSMELTDLSALTVLAGSLEELHVCSCYELANISAVAELTSLRAFMAGHCWKLCDISPLASLHALRELRIIHCLQVSDVSLVSSLPLLMRFEVIRFRTIKPPVEVDSHLLTLHACLRHDELSILGSLKYLRELRLSHCFNLVDIASLTSLPELHTLFLSDCYHLNDISPLAFVTSLRDLSLSGFDALHDISPLASLMSLEILYLSECWDITGCRTLVSTNYRCTIFSPLGSLAALRTLTLSHCHGLRDFSWVSALPSLRLLECCYCSNLKDVSNLATIANLREVVVIGCPSDLAWPEEVTTIYD